MDNDDSTAFKLVTVGDGTVGKTCLLHVYAKNEFPDDYVPTVFDNYCATQLYKDKVIQLHLWDTAGQEEYGKLRHLSYPGTDCFVICFSLVDPDSYSNIKSSWAAEIDEFDDKVRRVLVGTKLDLRENPKIIKQLGGKKQHPITQKEGQKMANAIGACAYYETSAKSMKGIREMFDGIIHHCLDLDKKEDKISTSKRLFTSLSSQNDVDDDVSMFKKSQK